MEIRPILGLIHLSTFGLFLPIIIILFVILITKQKHFKRLLPPGPKRIPFIGTIYKHGIKLSPESLTEMSSEYGPIFSIFIGTKRIVVLNSFDCITAAMKRPEDFGHRGVTGNRTVSRLNPRMRGFAMRDYDAQFTKTRTKSVSTLRGLGVGKNIMQDNIIEEAEYMMDSFKEKIGDQPFSPVDILETSVANVALRILINKRFGHCDKTLNDVKQEIHTFTDSILLSVFTDFFPFLEHLPPFKRNLQTTISTFNNTLNFIWNHALDLLNENHETGSSFVKKYAENHEMVPAAMETESEDLKYILQELFIAGLESVPTILQWIIIYVTNRPEMQTRLISELTVAMDSNRPVTMADREHLPFTEAVILESLRFSCLTPLVIHMSNQDRDTELCGYTIPKQSILLINQYSVNMDHTTWSDPRVFNPDRFLDTNGNVIRNAKLLSFGAGKRTCPGELLAKQQLFLFTANLFRKFSFQLPHGVECIDEEPLRNSTWKPKPFKVKIVFNRI